MRPIYYETGGTTGTGNGQGGPMGGGTGNPTSGLCGQIPVVWNAVTGFYQDAAGNFYDRNCGAVVVTPPIGAQPADPQAACAQFGLTYNPANGYCGDGAGAWYDLAGHLISRDGVGTTAPAPMPFTVPGFGDTVNRLQTWATEHKGASLAIAGIAIYFSVKGKK